MQEEAPGLVHEKGFERGGKLRIMNNHVGPMQDVKQQRLNQFGMLVHALEVEALEAAEGQCVLCVVEGPAVLAAVHPAVQLVGQVFAERIGQHAQGPQFLWKLIKARELLVQLLVVSVCELVLLPAFDQRFEQCKQEIEILLGGRERKWINGECLIDNANSQVGTAKDFRYAFQAAVHTEDDVVGE